MGVWVQAEAYQGLVCPLVIDCSYLFTFRIPSLPGCYLAYLPERYCIPERSAALVRPNCPPSGSCAVKCILHIGETGNPEYLLRVQASKGLFYLLLWPLKNCLNMVMRLAGPSPTHSYQRGWPSTHLLLLLPTKPWRVWFTRVLGYFGGWFVYCTLEAACPPSILHQRYKHVCCTGLVQWCVAQQGLAC